MVSLLLLAGLRRKPACLALPCLLTSCWHVAQTASPAELAWETVGGVGYVRPSAAPSLLPAVTRVASCAEWTRRGFHLVPQVDTLTDQLCQVWEFHLRQDQHCPSIMMNLSTVYMSPCVHDGLCACRCRQTGQKQLCVVS